MAEDAHNGHQVEKMRRRVVIPAPEPVETAPLSMGDGPGTAENLRLTTRYVERDGVPWIPVMGEYHFSRDRPERWQRELHKIAAGGVNVVSTYLLWILHEEVRGKVRWDEHLDLRRWVEAADAAGLKVMIRIGPWAHGETRNGGFPDWLQALPIAHRTDDPAYLDLVRGWFTAIEEQVRGLSHGPDRPGGPIIGVQIENELYDQPEHLGSLRRIAESVGLRASFWTATGWGGAQLPPGSLLPVYAGYSDGFWEESDVLWPDFGPMHFSYSTIRDDLTVGADLRTQPAGPTGEKGERDPWPFVTCELGGGMQVAYHRRPLVDPGDVAALALTKIGSGSAWQGYYLYHGGTQVPGELSGTQESQDTGYPNDVPVRDYDFFAPIGAAGAQRPHFHKLRRQHLFLQAYGSELARYPTVLPEPADDVRWAVRANTERGYLFVNNYQPALAALPGQTGVQFEVEFADRSIVLPRVDVASGAYFTWPLRQRFGDVPALTVTAQPITELEVGDETYVLFAATRGIDVELFVEGVDADWVLHADVEPAEGGLIVRPQWEPGQSCEIWIGMTTLVFLDEATADAVWKGEVAGRERLLIWPGNGWFDGGFHTVVEERDCPLEAFPALSHEVTHEGQGSVFTRYLVPGNEVVHPLIIPAFPQAIPAPVRRGGPAERFSAPVDEDFADLEAVAVQIPPELLEGAGQIVLRLSWTGDVLRLYAGQELIADQFWSGRELEVDLAPFQTRILAEGLWLKAFAWAPDSGVFVDPRVRPQTATPLLTVHEASLIEVRTQEVR